MSFQLYFKPKRTWVPASDVSRHDGRPLCPDFLFFSRPAASIGKIVSAESTVNRLKPPLASWLLLSLPLSMLVLSIAGCSIWAHVAMKEPYAWAMGCIPGVLIGILAMLVTLIIISPKTLRLCTFVGEKGIASYEYRGAFSNSPLEKMLIFQSGHELFIKMVDNHLNHVYLATDYKYTWRNEEGEETYRMEGSFRKNGDSPPLGDRFWYAIAAEKQWNSSVADRLKEELRRKGCVSFSVNKRDRLTVGPGYVDVTENGDTKRLTPADVKAMGVVEGRFVIRTHDARWFHSRDTHEFFSESIGNLKLFLEAVQQIGGFKDSKDSLP